MSVLYTDSTYYEETGIWYSLEVNVARKWLVGLGLLALFFWAAFSWAAGAQDATSIVNSATKALGSENLKTIEYSGSGYDFALGQAEAPGGPWPKFNDKTYTRVINFETPASRMSRIRTQFENPPRGGAPQPIIGEQQQNQIVVPGSPQAAGLADDLTMSHQASSHRLGLCRSARLVGNHRRDARVRNGG